MIEVKPKYLAMPLSEEQGLELRLPRRGKEILGFQLYYDGDVTKANGKLKDASKPQRVFLNELEPLVGPVNTNPAAFVELFTAIEKLQSGKK